ncbi:MAG TPA: hypothetical protein GXX36_15420 [Clostridiaceae bacterium]|nr:hypothetical protein [Clostridiaceae bacterium]
MKARKVIRFLLIVAVLLSIAVPVTAASPEEFTDIPDNWSKTAIIEAISNGLLNGSNGKIMPDASLRRCEMAAIINRAFGATQKGDISKFIDIKSDKWYAEDMAKAVKMGTFSGSGNQMRPEDFITRQEAFAVLARAFKLKTTDYSVLDKFNDKDKISEWAKPEVAAVVAAGYVKGSNGSLNPTERITRAEFAQVMYNMVKTYIKEAGTYTTVKEGNVMINVPGVTLKGVTVKGDLIIGDGVGKENVTLDNVKVEGRVVVRGGGSNSVHVINGSEIDGVVIIDNVNNEVRIVTDSGTTIKKIEAGSKTILEGNFGEVRVIGSTSGSTGVNSGIEIRGNVRNLSVDSNSRITLTSGTVSSVTVGEQGAGSEIIVSGAKVTQLETLSMAKVTVKKGTIDNVTVGKAAQDTTLDVAKGAEVGKVTANAKAVISGSGTVTAVEANADDIRVDTKGTKLTVKKGVKGVIANGEEVEGGTTITTGETEEQPAPVFFPGGDFPGGGFPGGGNDIPGGNDDTPEDKERKVSGTVSLPDGDVAPAGGIDVYIRARNDNGTTDFDDDLYFHTYAKIPEGQSSAEYSIILPTNTAYTVYTIQYSVDSGSGYLRFGYYSAEGTTYRSNLATFLNIGNGGIEGIDLELIPANLIFGTISLPDGEIAPEGGISGLIDAECDNGTSDDTDDDYIFNEFFHIPQGESSVDYILPVIANPAGTGYVVSYFVFEDEYEMIGYYSVGGTVSDYNSATLVDVSSGDAEGIDLELISGKNNIISGTVSLPDGDTAPAGGVRVHVMARNVLTNSYFISSVTIPEGENSVGYSIRIPVNVEGTDYVVLYEFLLSDEDYGYGKRGYYSKEGTRVSYSSADYINVSNGNVEEIDLEILHANIISGTISLPEGEFAPEGGIKVSISALNYYSGYSQLPISTTVTITEGESSVNYSLAVPVDAIGNISNIYMIEYSVYSEPYKIDQVYYSIDGATSLFDISRGDVEGINIELLPTNIISGTISLPDGYTAPAGGIGVSIYAGNYRTQVTIPEGQNSVEYSLPVASNNAGSGYTVRYYISPEYGYVQIGYYSTEGTVLKSADGTIVDVSSGTTEGINLELIPGNTISGTVFFPENFTAPADGITVIIEAKTDNGTPYDYSDDYYININKTIPKGKKSVQYSLVVPANIAGAGYIVNCSIITNYWKECGYYSDTGTVPDRDSATPVDVSNGDAEGIDIEILLEAICKDIDIHISLPYGDVAPEGGIDVTIFAVNNNGTPDDDSDDFSFNTEVKIFEGTSDAYCTLFMPAYILSSKYVFHYEIDSGKGYLQKGYYSITGTIDSYDLATPVDVNTISDLHIDLDIIYDTAITGTVTLPDGDIAPAGGIRVGISAFNNREGLISLYQANTIIPEGKNSARYYLPVPPTNDANFSYQVFYFVDTEFGYVQQGYYSNDGTTPYSNSHTPVNVSSGSKKEINFELLPAHVISGTISLPGNDTALSGGIHVVVSASHDNGTPDDYSDDRFYYTVVEIPYGKNSINYSLPIYINDTDISYIVGYEIVRNYDYTRFGYYSDSGTTPDRDSATPVDVSNGDVEGIDFELIPEDTQVRNTSGIVSLPESDVPATGGIEGYSGIFSEESMPKDKSYNLYYDTIEKSQ